MSAANAIPFDRKRRFGLEAEAILSCPPGWTVTKCPRGNSWQCVPPSSPPAASASAPASDPFAPKKRRALTRRFDKHEEKPLVVVYPGLLWAGKHTTVAGDPGLGKSLLSIDLTSRITRGGKVSPYSAQEFEPRTVIMCSAEDDAADTIKPRLRVAGADMTRVHDLLGVLGLEDEREHLNLGAHLQALDEVLGDLKPAALVLDPLSSFLGRIDSHQNSQVRSVVDPTNDLLQRHGVALLSIQHLNKNEKASALYRIGGSISLVGAPRAAFVYVRDPTQGSKADRWLLPAKRNLIGDEEPGYGLRIVTQEGQPRIEWRTERVDRDVNEALSTMPLTKAKLAEDVLRTALENGVEIPAADIERMCRERGIGRETRRDALHSIGAQTKRVGEKGTKDGRWVWYLPPRVIQDDEGFDDAPHSEIVAEAARAPLDAAVRQVEDQEWLQ